MCSLCHITVSMPHSLPVHCASLAADSELTRDKGARLGLHDPAWCISAASRHEAGRNVKIPSQKQHAAYFLAPFKVQASAVQSLLFWRHMRLHRPKLRRGAGTYACTRQLGASVGRTNRGIGRTAPAKCSRGRYPIDATKPLVPVAH